jgi:hypothetical protein
MTCARLSRACRSGPGRGALGEALVALVREINAHAHEAIELARALGQLPPRLIVYGVEGADFTAGEGLSLDVEKAAQAVVRLVLDDVAPFL